MISNCVKKYENSYQIGVRRTRFASPKASPKTEKTGDSGHKEAANYLKVSGLHLKRWWSWRESNPRPNRETIRFLHAYSSLWFSSNSKTWTTN